MSYVLHDITEYDEYANDIYNINKNKYLRVYQNFVRAVSVLKNYMYTSFIGTLQQKKLIVKRPCFQQLNLTQKISRCNNVFEKQ